MNISQTPINGLLLVEPKVFKDPRGYFYESYSKRLFESAGINYNFVQDNQSLSQKNVLRGLHFQKPPHEQGKLVRVIKGSVQDVAVDIRKNSPDYGKHYSVVLSDTNHLMLWIPPGFAHGFLTLEDNTIFQYKCTNYYNKSAEDAIRWNDASLHINWQSNDPVLSEKDSVAQLFSSFKSLF